MHGIINSCDIFICIQYFHFSVVSVDSLVYIAGDINSYMELFIIQLFDCCLASKALNASIFIAAVGRCINMHESNAYYKMQYHLDEYFVTFSFATILFSYTVIAIINSRIQTTVLTRIEEFSILPVIIYYFVVIFQ